MIALPRTTNRPGRIRRRTHRSWPVGEGQEGGVVDDLDVAVGRRVDHRVGRGIRDVGGIGLRAAVADVLRVEPVDRPVEVPRDGGDELGRLDRLGDVMEEVDEHPDAQQGEPERDGDRDLRHELRAALAGTADRAEDEDAEGEGPGEDAERRLARDVAHEERQEPRPELGRGEDQGDDRDREAEPGDGDHRAGDGREQGPRPVGAAGVHPAGEVDVAKRRVRGEGDAGQQRSGQDHEPRDEPEGRAKERPVVTVLRAHGRHSGSRTAIGCHSGATDERDPLAADRAGGRRGQPGEGLRDLRRAGCGSASRRRSSGRG